MEKIHEIQCGWCLEKKKKEEEEEEGNQENV